MAAKLFARYNRINLPIILVVFVLSGWGCYAWINRILIGNFDDSLSEHAVKIDQFVSKNHRLPVNEVGQDWQFSISDTTFIAARRFEMLYRYDHADGAMASYRKLTYGFQDGKKSYRITITRSLEALQGLTRSIALTTTITLLSVALISFLLSRYVLKTLWRPFYDALASLRNFKLGKKTALTFTQSDTEEFNFMNQSVSDLIDSAERDYRLLKEFTENASHEMQTPVAIIRSKLDLVMQRENLLPEQSAAMESAYSAVRRLSNLTRALLMLAKIENHQFTEFAAVDLEAKISEIVQQLADFWTEKNLTVDVNIEPSRIIANPVLVDLLLTNLLSNASRHNVPGGNIAVELHANSLLISNTGTTEPLDPERLYSRFYKREQNSAGNGLGLAIIKQICDRSGIHLEYSFVNGRHQFSFSWEPVL